MSSPVTSAFVITTAAVVLPLTGPAPESVHLGARDAAATAIEATLRTIDERRRLDLVPPDENAFMFDGPGLTLTFALALPEGRTLLEIAQPEDLAATDSAGTDLTAIEPDFMGELSYVEVEQMWGEPPTSFDFTLALPERSAESFDLAAELTATTYASLDSFDIPLTREWKDLDAALFGGVAVSARLTDEDGSPHVELRPGTVRRHIEEVQLITGGQTLESGMSMWNDQMLTFMFEGDAADAMTLKLQLRRGLEQSTITINLDDQDLP